MLMDQHRCESCFAFTAYGLRIGVFGLPKGLPPLLPFEWQPLRDVENLDRVYSVLPSQQTSQSYRVCTDATLLAETDDLESALTELAFHLELDVVETNSRYVFIHAGVVGWQGRAIVIPGHSYSGKSSLVAALTAHGATYYSDEYALLDQQGQVHAFPRPLRLRAPLPNVPAPIDHPHATQPLPISLVVLTHFQADSAWNPQPISPGATVLRLLANAMSTQQQPEKVLTTIKQATAQARGVQSLRPEAFAVVEPLLLLAANCPR